MPLDTKKEWSSYAEKLRSSMVCVGVGVEGGREGGREGRGRERDREKRNKGIETKRERPETHIQIAEALEK